MPCDVLTGDTGGDDNNVSTGEGKLQAIVLGKVAGDFLFGQHGTEDGDSEQTYGNRGDVREISSHTRSVDNIIQGKLINERRSLEEKGERLNQLA
jgi:flavin-dependent dehydrogenase